MHHAPETICVKGVDLLIHCPSSYADAATRRFPLLISLGALGAEKSASMLHRQGILPELIVAEIPGETNGVNLPDLLSRLSDSLRILDSPSTRWVAGAGHSAVTAMHAVLDHPEIFGRGACLSTSFEGPDGAPPLHSPVLRSLEERTILPRDARLYFDYGTTGIDECYEPYHRDLGSILRGKGWKDGRDFVISRHPQGAHTPESWRERLGPALHWLAGR